MPPEVEPSQSDKIWNHPALRWIAVIPGAVVVAILTTIITNIMGWMMGSGEGTWFGLEVRTDDPNDEINRGLGYHLMKYALQPGMIAGAFVYAARVIAPTHKQVVGWLFVAITLLVAVWFYTLFNRTVGHLGFWQWLVVVSYPVGGIVGVSTNLEHGD